MSSGKIFLLSGEIESGKTSLCLKIASGAKELGLDVAGIVSPAVFENHQKTAIDARNLRTGESRRLASLHGGESTGLETKRWTFFPEVVTWGNKVLSEAIPCDLLIVDELGPLEFLHQKGWVEAFQAIKSKIYQVAVVVVRPSLIEMANSRWEISRQIDLNLPLSQSLTGNTILTTLGLDLEIG